MHPFPTLASHRSRLFENVLQNASDDTTATLPPYDVIEWDECLDSSDISATHLTKLVDQICKHYTMYSGFLILHGTDTLAFTASALTFMLENLTKPVIITGAMLPYSHICSDAKSNVAVSLIIAGYSNAPEVLVCFGRHILRGCRTTKIHCGLMDAFDSPNSKPLGTIGIDVCIDRSRIQTVPVASFKPCRNIWLDRVIVLRMTPGLNPDSIRHLVDNTPRPSGLILELYGTGTAQCNDSFLNALKHTIESEVYIVAVTQCIAGTCSLRTYRNGLKLLNLGVIEGRDMTTEAAMTKLAYLLAEGFEGENLRHMMETDLRGEISKELIAITGQETLHPLDSIKHSNIGHIVRSLTIEE